MSMLILASASGVRARLLREAGLRFGVRPADLDETMAKAELRDKGVGNDAMAGALAEAKAQNVSRASPQMLVLGCDQVLVCGDRMFDKPRDLAEARENLQYLRGKSHTLISACVLVQAGNVVWRHEEPATLIMRDFSDDFLEDYLKAEGSIVLGSVGCYQLEGRGAQLFEKVQGDIFAILGLPLIPLLGALRQRGMAGK
jgi:septum formation protein